MNSLARLVLVVVVAITAGLMLYTSVVNERRAAANRAYYEQQKRANDAENKLLIEGKLRYSIDTDGKVTVIPCDPPRK